MNQYKRFIVRKNENTHDTLNGHIHSQNIKIRHCKVTRKIMKEPATGPHLLYLYKFRN